MKTVAILGAGLAGGFLAAALAERGCRILLFYDPAAEGASHGAAGLYNVVTGRRMSLTWGAPLLVDSLNAFFDRPFGRLLAGYRQRFDVYRPYPDAELAATWAKRFDDPEYQPWIVSVDKPISPETYRNPLGGFMVQGVGRLQVAAFLEALWRLLEEKGQLERVPVRVDYADIDPGARLLKAGGREWHFDALAFCEGMAAAQNPFWDIRPLIPLKGQVLRVAAEGLRNSEVWVGEGVFILPEGAGRYTLGSTYETRFEHALPTPEGRDYLLQGLRRLAPDLPSPVVEWHWANLRPATADHLPVGGQHRKHPALFFLNGLGSKGVLHGAAMAEGLADWVALDRDESLHPAFHFYRPVMVKPRPLAG